MTNADDNTHSPDSQKIDFADYGIFVVFTVTRQTWSASNMWYTIRRVSSSWSRCCKDIFENLNFEENMMKKPVFDLVFRMSCKISRKVTENKRWNINSHYKIHTILEKNSNIFGCNSVVYSMERRVENTKIRQTRYFGQVLYTIRCALSSWSTFVFTPHRNSNVSSDFSSTESDSAAFCSASSFTIFVRSCNYF